MVTALTGATVAQAAWNRFQVLSEYHKGVCARTQITRDVY